MKWILIICLLFLANCAKQTNALVSVNSSNQNTSANQNKDNVREYLDEVKKHNEKVGELEKENKRFRTIPEEFKNVDFRNFTYPTDYPKKSITLKKGEFEYEDKKSMGGGSFDLSDVFYLDLTGDGKKEAVVLLFRVDCGGSCDGGAYLLYIYNANKQKPDLLWQSESGSAGYGCGLKTLTIKEKKIRFELYARCSDKMETAMTEEEDSNSGKFTSIGFTEYVFKFNGKKFEREMMEFHSVGKLHHLNYLPEISIND